MSVPSNCPKCGPRVLVWFSCGAASAVAAKETIDNHRQAEKDGFCTVEVLYCDTLKYEHPDNLRFMKDVERWIGREIKILKSPDYTDIYDVFEKTGWLIGPKGARCTTELKKNVREAYAFMDDEQVLGFTKEEGARVMRFKNNNPDVKFTWALSKISKQECFDRLKEAGIELPMMYRMGYKNNNCIGCVKGQAGYWNKIRRDFPETFDRMAKLERKMNVAINKRYEGKTRIRVFLDELPETAGRYEVEPDIECGVLCHGEASA